MKRSILLLLVVGTLQSGAAGAAAYPQKPVRVVAASAPGGGTDFVSRAAAQKVTAALGQQFIVDNRGGAAGIVGSEIVAKAEPDGYTLLVVFSNFATYPSLGKTLSFDVRKSFQPITSLATTPLVLVVNSGSPVKSVSDLIAAAKQKRLDYAAPGVGSMGHLAAELFKIAAKVDMQQVAYKGGGPAITALIGNEVQLYFSTPPAALAQVKAGRLRALGVTSPRRAPFAPEVPTIAESGLPGYEVIGWFGLFAPAHTPASVVETLHRAFAHAVEQPDVEKLFAHEGVTGGGNTPQEFTAQVDHDIDKWAQVIRAAHIVVR
jgi:tripartite-type tricarboxylate transporter receptor subunit TctC